MNNQAIINNDLEKIKLKLQEFVDLVIKNYGIYISDSIKDAIKKKVDIVKIGNSSTISFVCIDGTLYLPIMAYSVFPVLKKDKHYATNLDNYVKEKDYLCTNTTYFDYINHVIEAGLTEYDYFEENLLHEVMHLCGSGGGSPLKEGINELKTRELAMKEHIKIAAMAYPKEVEIAKRLQKIIGKEVMDELTFNNYDIDIAYKLLSIKRGKKKAHLYQEIVSSMEKESSLTLNSAIKSSNPYDKAELYSNIQYFRTNQLLEEFISEAE